MKNNKGFSLVELIIVIAIMAILVGVMAPQLIKYIEKTNISSDTQLCDSVRTALMTAALDPDVVKAGDTLVTGTNGVTACVSGTTITSCVEETLGCSLSALDAKLKSKASSGKTIQVQVVNSNTVTVYVDSAAGIISGN